MTETVRLALVTDIHLGPTSNTKIGAHARANLTSVLKVVDAGAFDLVIDLGDRITDVDRDTDRSNLREVASCFQQIRTPRHHLLGNHDVCNLSREENEDILVSSLSNTFIDIAGMRLIFWNPSVKISVLNGFPILSDDLEWLEKTLGDTSGKAIVFSHVPVSGHNQYGNYYFQNRFSLSTYPQYLEILELAENCHQTCAWISGHVHWNTYTNVRAMAMFTLQSLTESFTTPGRPCGCWAEIECDSERISFKVHGLDPLEVHAPLIDRREQGWIAPKTSLD